MNEAEINEGSGAEPDGGAVFASSVKLQTNPSTIGMKSCVLALDTVDDVLSLTSEDGETSYFSSRLGEAGIKWQQQRRRFVFEVGGKQHRVLFQSAGEAIGTAFAQRLRIRGTAQRMILSKGLGDWVALFQSRKLI